METPVFWDITPCSPLKANRIFGEACLGPKNKPSYVLDASFLFGLFLDPKNGGEMFLLNVGWLSTDYMALWQKR
jgi:hypothetical protein